jgi:2-C-methyl-D-erythritol 4-phosphate cytidylyltransferase
MSSLSRPRGATHGRIVAVVLSAGQGTRMGADRNKAFLPLAGRPILIRSVEACLGARAVSDVLVVAHPNEVDAVRQLVETYRIGRVRAVVPGGASRHASEYCALNALRPDIEAGAVDVVLIHDAARPLVRPSDITRLIRAARQTGGALLASQGDAAETLGRVVCDDVVCEVFPPNEVWHAQTPQAFAAKTLLRTYDDAAKAGFEGTDTASALERIGLPVQVVRASPDNIKVTTPLDLVRAEALLSGSGLSASTSGDPATGE